MNDLIKNCGVNVAQKGEEINEPKPYKGQGIKSELCQSHQIEGEEPEIHNNPKDNISEGDLDTLKIPSIVRFDSQVPEPRKLSLGGPRKDSPDFHTPLEQPIADESDIKITVNNPSNKNDEGEKSVPNKPVVPSRFPNLNIKGLILEEPEEDEFTTRKELTDRGGGTPR